MLCVCFRAVILLANHMVVGDWGLIKAVSLGWSLDQGRKHKQMHAPVFYEGGIIILNAFSATGSGAVARGRRDRGRLVCVTGNGYGDRPCHNATPHVDGSNTVAGTTQIHDALA